MRRRSPMPHLLALALLTVFATPAALAAEETNDTATLTVTGEGEVSVPADRAVVSFGVVAESEEAAAAQERVNELMADVIDDIKRLDIADRHIQTTNLALHPIYESKRSTGPNDGPRIRGYRASYTLSVTVEKIDEAGEVIDAGLEAGVNQFQGIRFELKDDAAARLTALQRAAEEARSKAKTISEAMGVELAGIVKIDEGVKHEPPRPLPMARTMAAEADRAGASVQPGQIKVTATLTVHYRISD